MTRVSVEELPFTTKFFTYLPYFIVLVISYFREFFEQFSGSGIPLNPTKPGYPPLIKEFSCFFQKWLYGRISDLYGRPVSGLPGPYIDVMVQEGADHSRKRSLQLTSKSRRCLNLSSYNYLGFAENTGTCVEAVEQSVRDFGTGICTPRLEFGTTSTHLELESLMAEFIGKEDCLTFGMGYATNSTNIPVLAGRGDLIISDTLNHASIIIGCRSCGASIKVFRHNDPSHLEQVIRNAIVEGQPRTHRPWNRIIIIVEGIYSMEGEILKLPEIVAIKKKYKCYLYVDEAHSIGALGPTGRGVCEYWGVPTSEIDVLMGTFTKSFASVGGYICSNKTLVNYLRRNSYSAMGEVAMPVPLAQQIISSLSIIMGKDGTDNGKQRLKQLHDNTIFVRERLRNDGFLIIGNKDSPVIPLMVMQPSKMPAFSRMCLERNIAVVMASYPATELELSRARFCVSAGHTREDLEKALDVIKEIGDYCMLRYPKDSPFFLSHNQ